MEAIDLIDNYLQTSTISDNDIGQIRINRELRSSLCKHFHVDKNRQFAIKLLNTFIEQRKDPDKEILIDDLMLGCYILGLHRQIGDCLIIWKAKNIDYDSYSGVDIQLIAFAGVAPTISFLQTIAADDAKDALEYVQACFIGGDFDNLDNYFSSDNLPWWI